MDKPKFNFLDGVIIFVIILVVMAGVYLLGGKNADNGEAQTKNVVAEFQIQLIDAEELVYKKFEEKKAEGETVWVGVKERFEGKISEVKIVPTQKITDDTRTGKAVLADDPSSTDVIVTVRAEAVENNSQISASGTAIRVGEETAVRGKGVAGFGYVVGIKTIAD